MRGSIAPPQIKRDSTDMFTGIIDALGTVHVAERDLGHCRVAIATPYPDLDLGESVSINGVCLTVVSRNDSGGADFFVSAETLARSNLDRLDVGHVVNLERAVSLSTRLSGHMVQGHVDGKGRLASVVYRPRSEGPSLWCGV